MRLAISSLLAACLCLPGQATEAQTVPEAMRAFDGRRDTRQCVESGALDLKLGQAEVFGLELSPLVIQIFGLQAEQATHLSLLAGEENLASQRLQDRQEAQTFRIDGLEETRGELRLRLESSGPFCLAEILPRFQLANPLHLRDRAQRACLALNHASEAPEELSAMAKMFGGMFQGAARCQPEHLAILSQELADLCRSPAPDELRGHCLRVEFMTSGDLRVHGLVPPIPKRPAKQHGTQESFPPTEADKPDTDLPQSSPEIGGRIQVSPSEETRSFALGRRLSVVLPPGSIQAPAMLQARALDNPPPSSSPAYVPLAVADISLAEHKRFDKAIELVYRYDPARLDPGLPAAHQLSAASWNPDLERWEPEALEVDAGKREARISTKHLSIYGWWIGDEVKYLTTVYPAESTGQKARYRLIANKKIPENEIWPRIHLAADWLSKAEKQYRQWGFTLPKHRLDVILEIATGEESNYSPLPGNRYILIPWRDLNALAHDCAHELFHAVQNQSHWKIAMRNLLWWVETTAETAATFVHGGEQVAKIGPDWLESDLMLARGEHMYANAHFLKFAITRSQASFRDIWNATVQAASLLGVDLADGAVTRDLLRDITLKPLDAYFRSLPGNHSLHSLYQDFLVHLLFSLDSPLVLPTPTRFAKNPVPTHTKKLQQIYRDQHGSIGPDQKLKFRQMAEEEKKQIQALMDAEAQALMQTGKQQAIMLTKHVDRFSSLALRAPSPVLSLEPDGAGVVWSLLIDGPLDLERMLHVGLEAESWPPAVGACLIHLPGNRKLTQAKPVQCLARKQTWFKPISVKSGDGLHVLLTHFGTRPIQLRLQARASVPPMKLEALGLSGLGILLPAWFVRGEGDQDRLLSAQAWPRSWAGIMVAPAAGWQKLLAAVGQGSEGLKAQAEPEELSLQGRQASLQVHAGRIKSPAPRAGPVLEHGDWWLRAEGQEIEEDLIVQTLKLKPAENQPAIGLLARSRPEDAEAMQALLTSLRPVTTDLVLLPIDGSGFAIEAPSHWSLTRVPHGMDLAAGEDRPSVQIRTGKHLGGIADMETAFKESRHQAGARLEKQAELSNHPRSGVSARYVRYSGRDPKGQATLFHALLLQRDEVHLSLTAEGGPLESDFLRKLLLSLRGPEKRGFQIQGAAYSLEAPAGYEPQAASADQALSLKNARDSSIQILPMPCGTLASMQHFLEGPWNKNLPGFKTTESRSIRISEHPALLKRYAFGTGRILVLYFIQAQIGFAAIAVGREDDEDMLYRSLVSLKAPAEPPFLLGGRWRGQMAMEADEAPSQLELHIDSKKHVMRFHETGARRDEGALSLENLSLHLEDEGQWSAGRSIPGGQVFIRSKQICVGQNASEMSGEIHLQITGKVHKKGLFEVKRLSP